MPVPALGVLKRGPHVLSARVLDAQGRALDWCLRALTVESPLQLRDLRLDRGFLRDGEEVSGSVEVLLPEGSGARPALELEIPGRAAGA